MCSGGGNSAKRKAERRQREADREAERRQRELDALAAERSALAANQVQRLNAFKAKSAQIDASNQAQVAALETQQAEQVAGIRRAGNAASNSLRILGQNQPVAPTAKQTTRSSKKPGSRMTSARYQRGSGSMQGTNLSI